MLRRLIFISFLLLLSLPVVHAQDETASEPVTHVVQPGETLYRIALRYGITLDDLVAANDITNRSRILVGQSLVIPGLNLPEENDTTLVNPLIAGTPITYVVQPGDNLQIIANRYDTTVEAIIATNELASPDRITRGQELTIFTTEIESDNDAVNTSTPEEEVSSTAVGTVHIVQRGEILNSIAQRYGVSITDIMTANQLTNANVIYTGQQLFIPGVEDAATRNGTSRVIDSNTPIIAPTPTVTQGRQIIVDLSDQMTYAFEDGNLVYSALVSTGLPATPTVIGDFKIYLRYSSQTMSGPGYYLPGVQHVQYFYQGYALHQAYWHDNFGQPMSHGCVNMTDADAAWFYEFGTIGTPVRVQY